MGVLFISHDLGVVKEVADRVSVIYAEESWKARPRVSFFENPCIPIRSSLWPSIP